MLFEFLSSLQLEFSNPVIGFLFHTSPVWLPILLFTMFLTLWIKYTRVRAMIKEGGILLEIKLPRDAFKSPLAMEVIITSLFQTGGAKNYFESFLDGKHRPWFTFEIASIEGEIRFFVWTKTKYRKLIESQFYAQYPGVELYEAEDYTKKVFIDPEKISLWGTHFKLANKASDVYPIKTYIDYGLDREQEEEAKIDPMTSVLEFMGTMKAGEQVWIQILFQAHRNLTLKDDVIFPHKPDWKVAAKEEIAKKISEISGGDDEDAVRRAPTMGEKETISAMERKISKLPFEVGIRGFYIARKEAFDSIAITGLIGSFRQYNSEALNGFKLAKFTDFNYPWQDFRRRGKDALEHAMLNAYKLRSFFQVPYKYDFAKPFILNTEELATIFHLPGRVLTTPTVTKIPSKKSEAPSNLPI